MRTLLLSLTFAALGCTSSSDIKDPNPTTGALLELQVVTSAEVAGAVNSTLLIGADEVVVVDAQFTKSGATAVADAVAATGKPLTHVFISHAHPDHYFGTAVLQERFPDAKVVATAEVVEEMKATVGQMIALRKDQLGPEYPGEPIIPQAVSSLSVGGQTLELWSKLQGDTESITAVWVPSLGALIASDLAFSGVHAWTATTTDETREAWAVELEGLHRREGLKRVVPGHQVTGASQEPEVLLQTRDYVRAFNKEAAGVQDAAALKAAMLALYPDHKAGLFLDIGVGARFPAP